MCNKVAKVIVDIGKTDWPHKFPDFFSNIQRLMQNLPTRYQIYSFLLFVTLFHFIYNHVSAIGVNMITLVSEEFVTPKDNLLDARKAQLKQLLTSYLPSVLAQLTRIYPVHL